LGLAIGDSRRSGGFLFFNLIRSRLDEDLMRTWVMIVYLFASGIASAQESPRIKRLPPTPAEAERQAAEMAMNDRLLRKGDIVATGRGFLIFRGVASDGVTNQFEPPRSPMGPLPAK
jgi:hypothetical protein